MPRIKRWFPVSHDINADPEVWTLRRSIGEKALSVWLELLSISDRNEGFLLSPDTPETEVSSAYQSLLRSVSGKCQSTVTKVLAVSDFAHSRMWLVSDPIPRVRNYAKYHRTEERKKLPSGNGFRSLPDLTRPDLTPLTPLSGNGTRSHAPEKGKTAPEAWNEVLDLVRSVGRYGKPTYSSPDIEKAVRDMGGISTFCDSQNTEATKRQFLSAYNKITRETK